jgi:PPIC-type PPIASE domain
MRRSKGLHPFIFCLSLLYFVFWIYPSFAEQTPEDPYIATFDGGGVRVSEFKEFLKKYEHEKKGVKPTLASREALMKILIEKHLTYRHAMSQSFDKEEDVAKEIKEAAFEIITSGYIQKNIKFDKVTEEQAREYYQTHLAKYSMPEMRSGTILFIGKNDKSGRNNAAKSKEISEEAKQYMIDNSFKPSIHEITRTFSDRYPESIFNDQLITNYWKGKSIALPQKITDTLLQLKPDELATVELEKWYAIVTLSSITPPSPSEFSFVKNRIIAEMEAARFKKGLSEFIDKLYKEYHLTIDKDVFDKAAKGYY